MHKKLTRSRTHRVVSGVLGGLSIYLNIDPAIIRILFVLFVVATGFFPGVFVYLVAVFLIPNESRVAAAPVAADNAESTSVTDDDTAV